MPGLMDELALSPKVRASELEQQMASGGLPPEGMHHAILDGYREVQIEGVFRGRELNFKIVAGIAKGLTVKETLWSPKGEDEEKDEKARNRMRMFAHRLGLLKKVPTDDGKDHTYVPVEGKSDFHAARGAECIIQVKHEEDEYENKKGVKVKGKKAKLEWEGVLQVSDKRAEKVAKCKTADLPALSSASSKPAPQADKYDDL